MSSYTSNSFAKPHTPKRKPTQSTQVQKETPHSWRLNSSLKHTILSDDREAPANFKKAKEIEERVLMDLANAKIEGAESLINTTFPDAFLPVTSDQINELLQNDALRNQDGWTLWPSTNTSISEEAMSEFVHLIGSTTSEKFHLEPPRHYSSMFHKYAINDPRWNTEYRPDGIVVGVEHAEKVIRGENATKELAAKDTKKTLEIRKARKIRGEVIWRIIQLIFEMKLSKLAEAISQGSRYAQSMFDEQPGRHFVLVVVIVGNNAMLLLYDRSGVIASEAINVHTDTHKFLRLILGILFVNEAELGFDSTIKKKTGDDDGLYIKTKNGVEYKVNCIYHEYGIRGRGTVCYRGVDPKDDSEVVIKDSWVDVSRKETETDILEKINSYGKDKLCTPDGVRVIPELVSSEIVQRRRPSKDGTIEWVDASTAIFREKLLERDKEGNPKWAWSSTGKDKYKIEIRVLRRVVMRPYGQKLETFASRKELMTAFGDIFYAIKLLYDIGIIHRDISFRNIVLHRHNGQMRGLLIDYDYAVSIERASSEAIAERTGTIPFMAIGRLQDIPEVPHSYYHDLESVFYVMCWICTLYSGPCSRKRRFSKSVLPYHKTAVAKWNGDTADNKNLDTIYDQKAFSVGYTRFQRTLDDFHHYFNDFKDCMWILRDLFFTPEICRPSQLIEYEEKKKEIDQRFDVASSLEKDAEKDKIKEYNAIPIKIRPAPFVLRSLWDVVVAAADKIPEKESVPVALEDEDEDSEDPDIAPRKVRHFDEAAIPAAHVDFTRGGDKRHIVAKSEGAGPSWPLPRESQGNLFNTTSVLSQKRKIGESSGSSSSKRSKSLMTPGNSTSEAMDKMKRTNPKGFPMPVKGPVNAGEPDVFVASSSRGSQGSRIIGRFEPNVENPL